MPGAVAVAGIDARSEGRHVESMRSYIKAVGAGAKRARALGRDEARAAMSLIARGEAEPVQVGAFLLALRMKGETAEELAGFADALSLHVTATTSADRPPEGWLEVDAHGDGHAGVTSLLPAAACAAAALGVPVCLSVETGSAFARHGLAGALTALGVDGALAAVGLGGALTPGRALVDMRRAGVGACDLALSCPPLSRLVGLRALLGVRSAAQTLAKLVSSFGPAAMGRRLVGVFHAPYLEPTARALGLVGVERGLVVQALGGLPEARPGKLVRVAWAHTAVAETVDFRDFPVAVAAPEPADARAADGTIATAQREAPDVAAARDNLAALAGDEALARRAAVAAALLVVAARGGDAPSAAADALAALLDGRARAVADRLRR